MPFKAVEVDALTRQRTGREFTLQVDTRQAAVDALLDRLARQADEAQVDPTRTLVHVDRSLWTIVATRAAVERESPSLRRGGAKHKRVR